MNHSSPWEYGDIDYPAQVSIDDICDLFEAELKAGRRPKVDDFLVLDKKNARATLAGELLAIELHYRSRDAEAILETYTRRFPDVVPARQALSRDSNISQSLQPGDKLGEFRIERQVGEGGMGVVYEAHDTKLDRQVALKLLPARFADDEQRLARFQREAKILAGLNHPNIATLHGFDEHEDFRFCVMEFVPGLTIAEILGRGRMPLRDVIPIFIQIAEALESAHEAGVVHRDLKPANVKVKPDGLVKVLDFGLAKSTPMFRPDSQSDSQLAGSQMPRVRTATDEDDTSRTSVCLTKATEISGTLPYMSPEQTLGKPVDKRSDIWSYGCCLYETIAGERVFSGQRPDDVFEAINQQSPDWDALPSNTPPGLEQLLRRCLVKDPRQRLRDIGDARIELANLQEQPVAELRAGRRRRAMHGAFLLVSAVIATMVLTGAFMRSLAPTPGRPIENAESRISVNLPPDLRLSGRVSLTISPDGGRLAYVASRDDGVSHLYVRDLNRFESVKLEDTEFAQSPFFSPDGRKIAFFAKDSLKTVSVSGGSPTIVCRGSFFGGGCWTPKHGILFNWDWGRELHQVSPDGSNRRRLFRDGKGRMGWPQLLPDGQLLLTSHGEILLMPVAPLDREPNSAPPRALKIGRRVQFARYVSTGHLLYAHDGSLFSVPFQLNPPRITGQEVLIVRDLTTHAIGADFAISAGGDIVYVPGKPTYKGELVWVSRQDNETQLAWPGSRQYSSFKLSPDGKRLAIGVVEDDGTSVWIYDFENSTSSLLTAEGNSARPIWTPDSQRVVFQWTRDGQAGLYWTPPGSQQTPELLSSRDVAHAAVCFSNDGKKLICYFDDLGEGFRSSIFELDIETGVETPLLDSPDQNEAFGELSPDGQWLVYLSSKDNRDYEVFIARYTDTDETYRVSSADGHDKDHRRLDPMWSRTSSNTIFFWEGDLSYGRVMAATIAFDPFRVVAIEPAVTEKSIDLPGYAYDYDPQNDRFLIVRPEGDVKPSREIRWLRNSLPE